MVWSLCSIPSVLLEMYMVCCVFYLVELDLLAWLSYFWWHLAVSKGKWVSRCHCRSKELGVQPVVACGVTLEVRRKSAGLWERDLPSLELAHKACLNIWLKRSTTTQLRWGDKVWLMCFIPFSCIKVWNSSAVNCGPLSDTTCSGKPNVANNPRSLMMVLAVVVVDIWNTSGNFEWASTRTKGCTHEWSRKINVDALPWFCWPCPWVEGCSRWRMFVLLTFCTCFGHVFYICIRS